MVKELLLALVLGSTLLGGIAPAAEVTAPGDAAALAGLTGGKAIFDVTTKEPGRLLFVVKLIGETYDSMLAQGVQPDFVVSFRGGTLPLLRQEPERVDDREKALLSEVRERIAALEKDKARIEACNVAAGIFKVTPDQLAPGITMIGNSLVSLIGYQNKGYALVPMQ
jgi:intracellular sulfur oxidation DsrE/DsrF family protein